MSPALGTPAWPWAVSRQRFCQQLDFLKAEGYTTLTMGELVAAPHLSTRTAVITFDDGYVDNLAASEALQERDMRATWFIVSGSVGQRPAWAEDGRPVGRLLTASELRRMHAAGMEIGSHTVNHPRLPDLDAAALHHEISHSKSSLEDLVGECVSSFAYPYGAWDERCADAVRRAGYRAACTTRTGWAQRDGDPYRLRRLTVFNHDTLGSFARKFYFGSHDVAWRDIARYAIRRLKS